MFFLGRPGVRRNRPDSLEGAESLKAGLQKRKGEGREGEE
jgi:hypothetical protein